MKYDGRVCKFNMDTGCVELRLRDGRMISIDCTGLEDELDVTMAQRSELDYLIYSKPYAQKARARAAETAAGCGLSATFRGLFCVREAAFSENAAKLQKKLQFSHQKRRFPIDSLVIIGV
jgi:hypothetical protein